MSALIKPKPAADTKEGLLANLGDLSGIEIGKIQVLLAIYVRPQVTASGIALTQKYQKEDIYQGKVGLVVKIGSGCTFDHLDRPPQLHDWVVVRPSDTWPFDINTDTKALFADEFTPCRLAYQDHIRAVVGHPGMVW
jgi:hypothetical protein